MILDFITLGISIVVIVVAFFFVLLGMPLLSPLYRIMDWLEERDEKRYVELREKYRECNAFYYDWLPSAPRYYDFDGDSDAWLSCKLEKDVL